MAFELGDILHMHIDDWEQKSDLPSKQDCHTNVPRFYQITRMTKATAFLTEVASERCKEVLGGDEGGEETGEAWTVSQPVEAIGPEHAGFRLTRRGDPVERLNRRFGYPNLVYLCHAWTEFTPRSWPGVRFCRYWTGEPVPTRFEYVD